MTDIEIKNKIVAHLRNHESGGSASDIGKAIGHNRITVGKYLQVLKAEGVVTSKNVASAIFWQLAHFSKKSRILIVDDEKHIVDLIRLSLSSGRYDLYEAYDGEEALSMVGKIVPDLIILDLMMPKLNGVEVCKQLKANVLTQNIPVIILSAKGQIEDKTELLSLGVDDYLTKPFDPLELEARVANKIAKKHMQYSQHGVTGLSSSIITQETRGLWEQKKKWFEYTITVIGFEDFASVFGHKKSFEVLSIFSRLLLNLLQDEKHVFLGHITDSSFTIFSEKKLSFLVDDLPSRFLQMIPFFYPEYADSLLKEPSQIRISDLANDSSNVIHDVMSVNVVEVKRG